MDTIRFYRETFIELTTYIESQEFRRRQNTILGYPEHPRAATTDDVECFFSLTRRHLGDTFTVKEFRAGWRKLLLLDSKRKIHSRESTFLTLIQGTKDFMLLNTILRRTALYSQQDVHSCPPRIDSP